MNIGVIVDVDGVLVQGANRISGAVQAITMFRQTQIPFVLLTNNIANNEQQKAQDLNQILQSHQLIKKENVILSLTPIRQIISDIQKEGLILLVGRNLSPKEMGFSRYVLISQLLTCFPQTSPFSCNFIPNPIKLNQLVQRLGLKALPKSVRDFGIKCVIFVNTPIMWDEILNVLLSLLTRFENGTFKWISQEQAQLKMYCSSLELCQISMTLINPILYSGALIVALKQIFKKASNFDLHVVQYGKPCTNSFHFAKQQLQKNSHTTIQKVIVIGDNQHTDILGANRMGWESILVKTGTYKGEYLKKELEPSWIEQDVLEATKRIIKSFRCV